MIRLVLAEDQAMVRGALAALLRLESDFDLLAEAGDGEAAWQAVRLQQPDLLITDIEMPVLTGLELALRIQEAALPTRVVILTTFARSGYLRRALDAGVRGYLLKDRPAAELAEAVRRVYAGDRVVDPQLAVDAWSEPDPLSERERAVLRLAAEGLGSAAIGDRLGLSEGTIRNYLSEAISKVGGSNRIEAARIARERGLL